MVDYNKFLKFLEQENKELALTYILDLLKQNEITIDDLYQKILARSLVEFECKVADKEISIFKEHTRTSIIRTILECTYPYVLNERNKIKPNNLKVLVVCPSEELHEIGGIMITNYFIMAGFDARYIGANTPKADIINAVKLLKPDYLALSVTNYYNIINTKQIIDVVNKNYSGVKIIIGGQAFKQKGALEALKYDYHFSTFQEIKEFSLEVLK